jgi:hypothetical protein
MNLSEEGISQVFRVRLTHNLPLPLSEGRGRKHPCPSLKGGENG